MNDVACIKLVSGEELIAYVREGNTPLEVELHNPVVINKNQTVVGQYMQVSHWLLFTKHNKAVIKRDKIVVMEFGLEDNAMENYLQFVAGERKNVVTNSEQVDELLKQLKGYNDTEEYVDIEDDDDFGANTTIH